MRLPQERLCRRHRRIPRQVGVLSRVSVAPGIQALAQVKTLRSRTLLFLINTVFRLACRTMQF